MSKFHNRYSPTVWPYRLSDNSGCLTTAAVWQQRLSDNSACLKMLAVWHDRLTCCLTWSTVWQQRLSDNSDCLITFIMPYVFNWKRKFMTAFEPGSVNQMASDHSSIIFGDKIGNWKKLPYIFILLLDKNKQVWTEKIRKKAKNFSKFHKAKSCRQLP